MKPEFICEDCGVSEEPIKNVEKRRISYSKLFSMVLCEDCSDYYYERLSKEESK